MKRSLILIFLLSAAVLASSLLTACGENPTKAPGETSSEVESTAETTTEPTSSIEETEDPQAARRRLLEMATRFNEITDGKDLQKYDSAVGDIISKPIEKGKIVFLGSSSFTRWSEKWNNPNLEEMILSASGEKAALNHGIGGSNMSHLAYNYKLLVKQYEPKALCIYGMSNNSAEYNYTNEEIIFMLDFLLEQARQDFPGIHFYVGEKQPSLGMSDASIKNTLALNQLLYEYGDAHEDVTVIHTASSAFYYQNPEDAGSYKNLKTEIFVEDGVHLVPSAYEDYANVWREALKDELK